MQQSHYLAPVDDTITDNADTVQALVETGADVHFRDEDRNTPLILAATYGKVETMKVLLAHHADVNATNREGFTALMKMAEQDKVEMVETLLHNGANVNARDNDGVTALGWTFLAVTHAIDNPEKLRQTVACLLQHGASVQYKEDKGQRVMSLARLYHDKRLIQMLKQAGAK